MQHPRPETKLRNRFKNPVPIGELAKIYFTMITITKPTYKCEHCKKHYMYKGNCAKHEKACSKNPENFRACGDCEHCEQVMAEHYINQFEGSTVKVFICSAKDHYLHPPKVEHKGNAYDLRDKPNLPMPKTGECEHFELIKPNLPF